jgi:hypothetical protein
LDIWKAVFLNKLARRCGNTPGRGTDAGISCIATTFVYTKLPLQTASFADDFRIVFQEGSCVNFTFGDFTDETDDCFFGAIGFSI